MKKEILAMLNMKIKEKNNFYFFLHYSKIFILLGIIVLFLSFNAAALQIGVDIKPENKTTDRLTELSQKIIEKLEDVRTLSFTFTQLTHFAGSTTTLKAEVHYKYPDNLYIKYILPHKQEIIFSNGYLYTYIPEIKQVTKQINKNFNDIIASPMMLAISPTSFNQFMKDFNMRILNEDTEKKVITVEAIPKLSSDFDKMKMTFSTENYLLTKLKLFAPNFKSETLFFNYELNPYFEDGFFKFEPSPGVNIIEIK